MVQKITQYHYSDKLIQKFNEHEQEKLNHLYDDAPDRAPKIYPSVNDAVEHVKSQVDHKKKLIQVEESSNRKLNIGDAADLIIKNIAMTVIPGDDDDSTNLAIYDYDKRIYVMSYMHLNKYLVAILGSTSRSQIDSLMQTIVSRENELCYYNPLPKYKIAVGNGIFNCLSKELEEFTPYYTVLTRIKTNYVENAPRPRYEDYFTLEGMISDFANNEPARIELLSQIVKSILTGVNRSDAFFIILGPGGDGKSTMFTMISNMIGQNNASYLNFSEILNPEKLLTTLNKKLMLGMDNDVNLYIKRTALLKSMASHENITLQRKYMSSVSVEFSPVIVQLCNEMPRFSETGESMRRRVVTFKSENSHYANGTQNYNIKKYIQDKEFLEYALHYFLNDDRTPYYNDYNEIDKQIVDESLNTDDIIGQFIEEMRSIGYINEINKVIPLKHLYSLYLDWFNSNSPGSKPLGMRAFKLKITKDLASFGYQFDPHHQHRRVRALENENLYFTHMLEDYKEGYEFQKVIDNNNQVKCFELTGDFLEGSKSRALRSTHPINVVTYFDLMNDMFRFAKQHDLLDEIQLEEHDRQTIQQDDPVAPSHDPQHEFKTIMFGSNDEIKQLMSNVEQYSKDDLNQIANAIKNKGEQDSNILLVAQANDMFDEINLEDKREAFVFIMEQILSENDNSMQ